MKRLAALLIVAVAGVLTTAGVVIAEDDDEKKASRRAQAVSPAQLTAAGWFCVDVPENWVHCVPPGIDLEPPDVSESMINLNFYTHDANAAEAEFLGVETLIRTDVWNALPKHWPCSGSQREYHAVPPEELPPYGFMYCHHFNEPKKPPR